MFSSYNQVARQFAVMNFQVHCFLKTHIWWTISEPIEYVIFIPSIWKQFFFFGFASNLKCLLLTTPQMFSAD